MPATVSSRASFVLDLARGIAALAVVAGHVRSLFFLDFSELRAPGYFTTAVYMLTGLGHQAVMVFFVLSGFFIAASIRRARDAGRWQLSAYLVRRVVRLTVVLWPALLLGWAIDATGLATFGATGVYSGSAVFGHVVPPGIAERMTPATLAGNSIYLQTIAVEPFGSNGALWSLANEFWYYIFFPLLIAALSSRISLGRRVLNAALLVALMCLVGEKISLYFLVWLMGAIVAYAPTWQWLANLGRWSEIASAIVLVAMAPAMRYGGAPYWGDFLLGAATAWFTYLHAVRRAGPDERAPMTGFGTMRLAAISYSLYAVHLPVVVFARGALGSRPRWEMTIETGAFAACLIVAILLYAHAFWFLFEKRTDSVRRWVDNLLSQWLRLPRFNS